MVLLDNFPARSGAGGAPLGLDELVPRLRRFVVEIGARVELEASGGITLENVSDYGATGVDRISIGALTHSAPSLDFSFALEPVA